MSKLLRLVPFLALMALLMLPFRAAAGTAVLLRDIADDPGANVGSAPRQLTPFKDQVAFVATPPNGPAGVWLSDGTEAGTRLIHAGCPVGNCDENPGPEILGAVDGVLVFSVPIEGQRFRNRLWRTDGTVGGTEPLADDPDLFVEHDPASAGVLATAQALYFHACPDAARCGIWQSDGTPGGTKFLDNPSRSQPVLAGDRLYALTAEHSLLIYDTKTGNTTLVGGWERFPFLLTPAGGKVFFVASLPGRGTELWASDGTAAGTRALSRFSTPDPFAQTIWIKAVGDRAYFVANDSQGFELWRSDGTSQGTRRVTDFPYPDALKDLQPENLAVVGGKILFNAVTGATAAPRLWVSDGRPKSTAPFRSLCRPGACNLPTTGSPLVQIGGKVFFPAENGLWSTDGTPPGTRRFVDHRCTDCLGQSIFQALGARIVFLDRDAAHGVEIWSSNGNSAGTRRLTDMPEGNPLTGTVVAAGGRTFFLGHDQHGEEPWVIDGAGTRLLADIGSSAQGSDVPELAALGSRAVFSACDGSERAYWTSAGTPATTQPISGTEKPCVGSIADRLLTASRRLFFTVREPGLIDQLWSTDGGVPVQLTDFTSQTELANLGPAASLGDRLVLPVFSAGHLSLWTSDGTPEGTVQAIEIPEVLGLSSGLRAMGNEAYFTSSSSSGYALWRTDGTAAGTRKIAADVAIDSRAVRLGSAVLFTAYSTFPNGSFGGLGLWRTDGTAAGTFLLKELLNRLGATPYDIVAFQGKIYFFVPDGSFWSLWRSDGTTAGTVPVVQLGDPEIDEQTLFGLTVFAGKLFFAARDGAHGRELWTSDGTAAGTRMVADLFPGIDSSRPENLIVAGGALYFTAYDGVHGRELWTSDGTAAGTHLAQDIAPEGAASPRNLTVAGDHLYFTADDGLTGREVWSLPVP
jgi:ELWxxDGT repeat protein